MTTILLALLASIYFSGAFILNHGLRTAPEGEEDESGFRIIWRNNHPETANIICIWGKDTEECVLREPDVVQCAA